MKGYIEIMKRFRCMSDDVQETVNQITLSQFNKKVNERLTAWDILNIVEDENIE